MKEIKSPSFFPAFYHLPGQLVILLQQPGQIFLAYGVVILGLSHHRLHRNLPKSQIRQMLYIFRKIQIIVSEGPPHIIVHLIPGFRHLLKLGNDQVIAALPFSEGTHPVVNLPAAINAAHHIGHLPVGKCQHLIVQENTIGGQGETELFVVRLLQAASIGHQVLYHLPVHQGLTPEEIHLQIYPAAGVGHQEIQRLFPHLKRHQCPSSVVLPFLREAIPAGQIAVMGDMQTQGFHHSLSVLKVKHVILVDIRREQLPGLLQFQHFLQGFPQFLPAESDIRQVQYRRPYRGRVPDALVYQRLYQGDYMIYDLVYHMDGTAVHIHDNIVAVIFKLMYHDNLSSQCLLPFSHQAAPKCHCTPRPPAHVGKIISDTDLFNLLTALIAHCTGSLARRLAGGLAFAAAALLHGLLHISGC